MTGGGQPVLSFEQCFILFCSFPLLFAFVVGGLGFEFACLSPAGGMLFGVSGLLLFLFLLIIRIQQGMRKKGVRLIHCLLRAKCGSSPA